MTPYNSHNKPPEGAWRVKLCPFDRWRRWSSERIKVLPKAHSYQAWELRFNPRSPEPEAGWEGWEKGGMHGLPVQKEKLKITEPQSVLQRQWAMGRPRKEEALSAWGFRRNSRKEQDLRGMLEEGCYWGRWCGWGLRTGSSGYPRAWETAWAEVYDGGPSRAEKGGEEGRSGGEPGQIRGSFEALAEIRCPVQAPSSEGHELHLGVRWTCLHPKPASSGMCHLTQSHRGL